MKRPQAHKNPITSAILLAYIVYASFVFGVFPAQAVNTAAFIANPEGPRYLVKSNSQFLQRSFGVRHSFDKGFTADLSGIQVALAKLFGVELEPVVQLHILPELDIPAEEILGKNLKTSSSSRVMPSDQTPWGIETVYNNSLVVSTQGGEGIKVAVLDTGVLKSHPDLKNRVKECKDFSNPRFPVKDGACDDKNGHGTHVSGTILADGGTDKLGIYGVAPEASLFAYKVCGNDGSCWADDIAVALKTAADSGANIVNLSLGSDSDSSLIREAVGYAISKDVLIIAAAGNDGPYSLSIDYPAANVAVVAVGAIDKDLAVPDWSSRGNNLNSLVYIVEEKDMEFGAPGVGVESTWKNGGYTVLSGTSMSSPHIAGLAAKLWQGLAPEGEKAKATRDLLHQSAKDIWTPGDDDATGFGLPQVK
ncbi:MAG: S8 family serine peptidase [Patescibacteria group bacterium]